MIRRRQRRAGARLAIALALAPALAAPTLARAQQAAPSAAGLETARTLFKQGKERRASGDVKGALELLKAAHALGQTPITAVELARTHEMVGELVEARELALSVARMPVQSDETERSATARADAANLAEALRPRIPTLIVRLVGVSAADPINVTIDGGPLPPAARGQPRKVNPGTHTIVASGERRTDVERTVAVAESETKEVALEIPPPSPELAKPEAPPRATPEPARPPPAREGSALPLVPVGIATAAVGVFVGTFTGVSALSIASDLRAACPNGGCPAEQYETLDKGRLMGTISTVSFTIGAVGLATAILGVVLAKPAPRAEAAGLTPWLGAGIGGVRGQF